MGTIALAVLTAGVSLLAIPFYPRRCSICRSTAVSHSPPAAARSGAGPVSHARVDELEKRLRLVEDELEAAGGELHRLNEERDFYRQLLGDPKARVQRRGEE